MEEQLTKLATMVEEQNKIIASQSNILREMNTKLIVKGHDSSSKAGAEETKAPDSNLSAHFYSS
jgi:uncharacterized coiled-coil protein SlyX|tara:strand:- start:117 stop:308 length:192 start_codon:yes stop_codon:yes gene_type:complete